MLIVFAAKRQVAAVFAWKPLRIFPEMEMRNALPLQPHRPMRLFTAPPDFGIAWGSVLMVVAFIFYRWLLMGVPSHGVRISLSQGTVAQVSESPWNDTLGVFIDRKGRFLLNGQQVDRKSLPLKLQEELGKRAVWTVYFEANNGSSFEEAVYVIDTIQGLGAKGIWITPRMREEWRQKRVEARNHLP